MTMDDNYREQWRKTVALLDRCPDGIYTHPHNMFSVGIAFQCHTQDDVRRVRACFPGTIWKKRYDEYGKTWSYDGIYEGTPLHIYAVTEAPPSCHAIEETYEAQEYDFKGATPPPFKTVTKTRLKWICGGVPVESARGGGA